MSIRTKEKLLADLLDEGLTLIHDALMTNTLPEMLRIAMAQWRSTVEVEIADIINAPTTEEGQKDI